MRLVSPTVGLIPTTPLSAAGQRIEPSVSVPTARGASPAATPAPEPELEPPGERSRACGLRHWPPVALHPLEERLARKFAHSERLAFAMHHQLPPPSAVARPSASARGRVKERASEPAVVPSAADGVDVVLHEYGDAVQRTAELPSSALGVEGLRRLERVGAKGDHRVQSEVPAVGLGDALEQRLDELHARSSEPRSRSWRALSDRRKADLGRRQGSDRRPSRADLSLLQSGPTRRTSGGTGDEPVAAVAAFVQADRARDGELASQPAPCRRPAPAGDAG